MPRIVHFTATGPVKFDPNPPLPGVEPVPGILPWPKDEAGRFKILSICACGLSKKFPICDGTHKGCKTEEPDHVYSYDPLTGSVISKTPANQ